MLTGKPEYLIPYNSALQHIPTELQRLRDFTAGFADQRTRSEHLKQLTDAKLGELAETISAVHDGNLAPALAIVRTDRGNRLMEEIKRVSQDLETHEMTRWSGLMLERDSINQEDRRIGLAGIAVRLFC